MKKILFAFTMLLAIAACTNKPVTAVEKGGVRETTECSVEGNKKKPKNRITIQGKPFDVDLDIWNSIEWRKVLKEITEKAYWNYMGNLIIRLSDYVAPGTKQRERIITMLGHLLKEGYGSRCSEGC